MGTRRLARRYSSPAVDIPVKIVERHTAPGTACGITGDLSTRLFRCQGTFCPDSFSLILILFFDFEINWRFAAKRASQIKIPELENKA